MAKKKKIVKPHYIPKDQRKKNKPMAKETKILILGICAAVIVAAVLLPFSMTTAPCRCGTASW